MVARLLTLTTTLCLLAPAWAGEIETSEHGIINGEPVGTDEFPSAGQLILQTVYDMGDSSMPLTQPLCTCTLIAPDVLLSAAHCVDEFLVTFGFGELIDPIYCVTFEEDLSWMADMDTYGGNPPLPDDAICSSAFVQHDDWDAMEMMTDTTLTGLHNFHDLSLIFLETPIFDRAFSYVLTPEEGEQLHEEMVVDIVGYGQRTPEPMDIFNPDPEAAYKRYWASSFINELGEHEMQIGSDTDSGRKCHGDSGGPTYVEVAADSADLQRVIGVTSRAYNATDDCNLGGVDMRVDPFYDWIDEELRWACHYGWRTECDEAGLPIPPMAEEPTDDDDDDSAATDDDVEEEDGCQCRQGEGAEASLPLLLVGLAFVLVRRRS